MSIGKNRKKSICEWFSELADIPADVLCTGLTLELRGRNELLVCGCREIKEYSAERIKLSGERYELCVAGRELSMSSFSGRRICICGMIDAFDLCGGAYIGKKE